MALPFYNWSRTAASNATADSTVNWAEGMAPSAVNDSARAMMASTAAFRDDIAGAIATGGTSTAYTVTSYQVFDSLAHMNGQMIAFTPHTTNGATVTLNVDGLGAKPLRSAPSVELPAGVLVQGTPYCALYNSSDAAFYLHGFFDNPYNIPIGGSIEYWGTTSPNSSLVFPYGQAISRTTYATAFARMGTAYGSGDGSTTFNLPDCRGRVVAGKDDMGGSAASRLTSSYFGTSAASLGAVGGAESHTMTASESAVLNYTVTQTQTAKQTIYNQITNIPQGTGSTNLTWINTTTTDLPQQPVYSVSTNAGGNPHAIVQPTIIANKLIRII
jgi:microcystin-dependent protein